MGNEFWKSIIAIIDFSHLIFFFMYFFSWFLVLVCFGFGFCLLVVPCRILPFWWRLRCCVNLFPVLPNAEHELLDFKQNSFVQFLFYFPAIKFWILRIQTPILPEASAICLFISQVVKLYLIYPSLSSHLLLIHHHLLENRRKQYFRRSQLVFEVSTLDFLMYCFSLKMC